MLLKAKNAFKRRSPRESGEIPVAMAA